MDGQIYAIPNLRNFGNRFGLNIDKAIAEEFGIEPYHKWSLEEIDAFLHEVHENTRTDMHWYRSPATPW